MDSDGEKKMSKIAINRVADIALFGWNIVPGSSTKLTNTS